jgi:hypothetical protein
MVPLYFLITYILEIFCRGGVYDQYEGKKKLSVCGIAVGEQNLYDM